MHVEPTDVLVSYSGINKLVRSGIQEQGLEGIVSDEEAHQMDQMRNDVEMALNVLRTTEKHSDVMIAPENGTASLLLSFIAEETSKRADILVRDGKLRERDEGLEVMYDEHDLLGWGKSFFTWWRRLFGKHDWVVAPPDPQEIGDHQRIAILGDWGSGRYGAPVCSRSIDDTNPAYDMAVHLGDVYYSGTEKEIDRNFLALWPNTVPLSRACNSNHEMYTGGEAYFTKTLNIFDQPRGSSNFALANDNWLLIGLDTAYTDHDIEPVQLNWVRGLLEQRAGRRVVLFSHHQPFSEFEQGGDALQASLSRVCSDGDVFAWYWGHEHRCTLYDKHPTWGYGRCAGHSGFPYFRDDVSGFPRERSVADGGTWYRIPTRRSPGGIVLDGANPYVTDHEDEYGPHGYLSLELNGSALHERVHAADGSILLEQTLTD